MSICCRTRRERTYAGREEDLPVDLFDSMICNVVLERFYRNEYRYHSEHLYESKEKKKEYVEFLV